VTNVYNMPAPAATEQLYYSSNYMPIAICFLLLAVGLPAH
jgi:hypothetical protein